LFGYHLSVRVPGFVFTGFFGVAGFIPSSLDRPVKRRRNVHCGRPRRSWLGIFAQGFVSNPSTPMNR